MKIKLIIIFIAALTMVACKKNRPDKLEGDKAKLIGNWQWNHTYHRVGCQQYSDNYIYTAEGEGKNYSVIFEQEGRIKMYDTQSILADHFIKFYSFNKYEGKNEWGFSFYLDNDENKPFSGRVYEDSILIFRFPYTGGADGCDDYQNYFYRE